MPRQLAAALRRIYAKTGRQFIFLIDECNCIMRERQESEALQKQYLDFLRNLLKDQAFVALAYVTGISQRIYQEQWRRCRRAENMGEEELKQDCGRKAFKRLAEKWFFLQGYAILMNKDIAKGRNYNGTD